MNRGEEVTLQSLAQSLEALTRSLEKVSKKVDNNSRENQRLEKLLQDAKTERMQLQQEAKEERAQIASRTSKAGNDSERVKCPSSMTDAELEVLRQTFETYDHKGDGMFGADELIQVLQVLGWFDVTMDDTERMMLRHDLTGEAHLVNFTEFMNIYQDVLQKNLIDANKHKLHEMSFYGPAALVRWVRHDGEEVRGDITGPAVFAGRRCARVLVLNKWVECVFYVSIAIAATNSGVQTYAGFAGSLGVLIVDIITLGIFAVEVILKLCAESPRLISYIGFASDFWNLLDLVLLAQLVTLAVVTDQSHGLSGDNAVQALRVLRLLRALRAMRILRAAKVLPELTAVFETLVKSVRSAAYVGVFFFIIQYMFSIVGATLFGKNDPFHFGNLGNAMVSLFRVATLEDWTDIMYYQTYGCHGWADYESVVEHGTDGTLIAEDSCEHEAFGWVSVIFFVVYIMVSVFFVLNLFVGIIVNSSINAANEADKRQKEARQWAMDKKHKGETPINFGQGENLSRTDSTDTVKMLNPIVGDEKADSSLE